MGSKGTKKSLFKNTAMLYVLTASNYVFALMTVPYLTRVLGAERYGTVGFGQSGAAYMQLLLDFGFILSATAEVSKCNGDKELISRKLTEVTLCKVILGGVCLACLLIASVLVSSIGQELPLFLLFFAYVFVNAFIPDFVYRGIEMMEVVTYRAVAVKAFFVVCVFVFIREPDDYLMVPVFYLLGSAGAVLAVFAHLYRRLGIRLVKVASSDVFSFLRDSSHYFVSRIASTFYTALNTMVVGTVYPGSAALGCYTATDKVITAGKGASSPVADSLYPYMIRTKNYKLLVKLSLLGCAVLALLCLPVWIFAEPICLFVFGEEYGAAAPLMRILLPLVPISMASYLYGFPGLAPLGMASFANLSVEAGAVIQVALLGILYASGNFSIEGVCFATLITESAVLAIRVAAFVRGYKKAKGTQE